MTTTKERPILFSAPMVRAILEGRKTVTRRPVKGLKTDNPVVDAFDDSPLIGACWDIGGPVIRCPYGLPGDRLWVRETHADIGCRLTYRADTNDGAHCQVKKWTPAIHMFRRHSRILLEITGVRVERLQDISGDQAEAEGVDTAMCQQFLETSPSRYECKEALIHGFSGIWASINGPESWASNPWVWAVSFKQVTP